MRRLVGDTAYSPKPDTYARRNTRDICEFLWPARSPQREGSHERSSDEQSMV